MRRIVFSLFLGSFAIADPVFGQVVNSLVGQKVLLRSGINLQGERTTREEDDRAAATRFALDRKLTTTYLVEKVEGERVLLKIEKTGETGWVKRKDVLPLDDRMLLLTRAIKRDGSAINYNRRGLAWHVLGDQIKAIADFDEAIRLNPKDSLFHQNRAAARSLLGEWEKAIIDCNEAIRLNPKDAFSHTKRGEAKLRKGDINGAIADSTQAIRLDPKSTSGYHCRHEAWLQMGQYDKAIDDCSKSIALDPKSPIPYNLRAGVYFLKKELKKASADLDQVIQLDPRFEYAYLLRSKIRVKQGDLTNAIEDCDKSIQLNPTNVEAYQTRGIARRRNGDYAEAVSDFDKAIQLDASDYVPYYSQALILAACPKDSVRDGKKAVARATKACQLQAWKNDFCLDVLASAYAETGDFVKAIEWEEKALSLTKDVDEKAKRMDRLKLFRAKKPYRQD